MKAFCMPILIVLAIALTAVIAGGLRHATPAVVRMPRIEADCSCPCPDCPNCACPDCPHCAGACEHCAAPVLTCPACKAKGLEVCQP